MQHCRRFFGRSTASAHQIEEFGVVLGLLHLIEQKFHRLNLVHGIEQLAQNPGFLQDFRLEQQFLAACARAVDEHGGINALLRQTAIQMDFHIAGALEFFVDHFVHAAASIDQRGADDGQRSTLFDIACRAKKALGALQGVGIDPTGQNLAGGWNDGVVCPRQASDGVEQNDHIFFQFYQTLGLFDHHFGDLHVPHGGLVESGTDHFSPHRALHFSHFFRALVDQQHDEHHFRMIVGDGMRKRLQHHGLAAFGRGDQQAALPLADRGHDVDHTADDVLFPLDVALQTHVLRGEQRREVLEHDLVLVLLRGHAVDAVDLHQSKVTLAILGYTYLTLDGVASVQIETADLAGRDVDVVG